MAVRVSSSKPVRMCRGCKHKKMLHRKVSADVLQCSKCACTTYFFRLSLPDVETRQ